MSFLLLISCIRPDDGKAKLDIQSCPENPPEVVFAPDVSLLPATCTDGRKGWFSDQDLLEAGARQAD